MPDGSKWDVPVTIIAEHRANYYKHEFNDNIKKSLIEDTLPLFEDEFEIKDWAANNMDWSDVAKFATRVLFTTDEVDYQEGWVNGEKELL